MSIKKLSDENHKPPQITVYDIREAFPKETYSLIRDKTTIFKIVAQCPRI